MNTRELFQNIAKGMYIEFQKSAQVLHSGSKGTVRENVLKNFLEEGRLPARYAVGSGEVVGRIKDTSRQCDLLIYDRENGVNLLYDRAIQVYPIDCVYGIIEVKSSLSKAELIDSLDKIKTFKEMAPDELIDRSLGGGVRMKTTRPKPFGMVFAYSLSANSLESLSQNLVEWEKDTQRSSWPNYICVLNEGVIFHMGDNLENCIYSEQILNNCWPIYLKYKDDSLFHFYCTLHDMCQNMVLGPVQLMRYFDPATRIGKYVVEGGATVKLSHDGLTSSATLSETALSKIVDWCKNRGKITIKDLYTKMYGTVPEGMENGKHLSTEVYLYDPFGLPGLHELEEDAFAKSDDGRPTLTKKSLLSTLDLVIDGERYSVTTDSLGVDDFDIHR